MRKFRLLVVIGAAASFLEATATASARDGFTCEKIKERATRASCIQARDIEKNEALNKIAAEQSATGEREVATNTVRVQKDAKEKEQLSFVQRAKTELTRNYKDPNSAQFADLRVVKTVVSRTLCGSVNAKNSYGGYVGVKKFYIAFEEYPTAIKIWYEGDSTAKNDWDDPPQRASGTKLMQSEKVMEKFYCGPGEGYEVEIVP